VLVSFKRFVGAAAVASLFTGTLPAQGQAQAQPQAQGQAQAQPAAGAPAQKNWKDRAEYDLYEAIGKEATPAKRLELLNQWNEKYPASEFKLERTLLYLDTYQKLGQAPKMLETAKQVIAIDPTNLTALYWIAYLTTSLNNTAPDALDAGEKAGQALLNPTKPATTSDADWAKAKTDMQALGYKTIGWVNMMRKNGDAAKQNFVKALELNPSAGEISYWLGQTIIAEKKPETYPTALYHLARAAAYDGQGALPAEGRKQVDDYLTKAYTGFHGDTSGLAELRSQAKTKPLPAADFKIASVREIAEKKLAEEEAAAKADPELAAWKNMKNGLLTDPAYFDQMKGAKLPKLHGKVVKAEPKRIVLALSDATTEEVALEFEAPVRAEPGATLTFEGVAKTFTKEPFMLTLDAEKADVEGLSAAPAAKPAKAKAKPRRR
jgi:tetratricopeptide (TPR) repeat protein